MKYLIFNPDLSGHYLEYIHHEYIGASYRKNDIFIFILPPSFEDLKKKLKWPKSENINILFLSDNECLKLRTGGNVVKSFFRCKVLKKYIKIVRPDIIILNQLITYIPCIFTLLSCQCSIRGIIYKIPRHRSKPSTLTKIKDYLLYKYMSISNHIDTVWLLNDHNSAKYYNKFFSVDKFKFLPDPVNIPAEFYATYKTTNNPPSNLLKFVHRGGMDDRKGTDTIIEALSNLPSSVLKMISISFVGRIKDEKLRMKIENFAQEQRNKTHIYLESGFVSYERLREHISTADFILIPYKNIEQSSGILGYAAFFNKPVIGPAEGLLGELILSYRLGLTVVDINPESLGKAILDIYRKHNNILIDGRQYICENSISKFIDNIYS